MSRRIALTTTMLSVFTLGLVGGCQRQMGSQANGPFAPAGTLGPQTSGPLIPFGPIQGATRVPPPPTGSTQANNSYAAPTGLASGSAIGSGLAYDSFASAGDGYGMAQPDNVMSGPAISTNQRSSLGGMPVIDMTAGLAPTPYAQPQLAATNGFAPPLASQPTPNISVPPGDLAGRLRPLEPNLFAAAVPVPGSTVAYGSVQVGAGYAGTDNNVQPLGPTISQTSAWQPVQPASAIGAHSPYVTQMASGPSTDPVPTASAGAATNQSPNNNLLWRNPSTTR